MGNLYLEHRVGRMLWKVHELKPDFKKRGLGRNPPFDEELQMLTDPEDTSVSKYQADIEYRNWRTDNALIITRIEGSSPIYLGIEKDDGNIEIYAESIWENQETNLMLGNVLILGNRKQKLFVRSKTYITQRVKEQEKLKIKDTQF